MFKNETAATHSGMIDIHAHILPGFDDGAKSLSDAMIMAEMAEESGVNAIVATPHVHSSGGVRLEMVEAGVETLRQKLLAAGTEIAVFPGMEIMADDAAPSLLAKGKMGTLKATRYPLLEYAFSEQPERMTRLLMRTASEGFVPIVAHPERYYAVQDMPELAAGWGRSGLLLQLDKGSLFGRMGERAARCARTLLNMRCIHVIASDAHGPAERTASLYRTQEYVALRYSYEYAQLLLEVNPRAILLNQPVLQPALEGI